MARTLDADGMLQVADDIARQQPTMRFWKGGQRYGALKAQAVLIPVKLAEDLEELVQNLQGGNQQKPG